jgi:DNA-binding GntR family transcriptional regulator
MLANPTPLAVQLAQQIARHVHAEGLQPGAPLSERHWAMLLRVSRSPVRGAMQVLETEGIVSRAVGGGYVLAKRPRLVAEAGDSEQRYLTFAQLHLSGALPPRISEAEVMRRLGLPRALVQRLLARAAEEGWAERLPGHGWALRPVLSSEAALAQSYRFRMVIEPAGLLDPGFQLDGPALRAMRSEIDAVRADPAATPAAIFALGLRFHQTLMAQSGNALLIEALAGVTTLRRLAGYQRNVDRLRLLARCQEHIELINLVLDGQRQLAARRLRRHIAADMRDKLGE